MCTGNVRRLGSLVASVALATSISCQQRGSLSEQTEVPEQRDPPNILLVVLDTTRADYFSCYGHPKQTTPNIDKLAAGGIRFNHAFATDFWTLPSHASLFTGLYPTEAEATTITNQLPEHNLTLAERLHDAAYRTGAVVYNPWISKERGFAQGFDDFVEEWREENGDEVSQRNRKILQRTKGRGSGGEVDRQVASRRFQR